jgi:hypothetical protein
MWLVSDVMNMSCVKPAPSTCGADLTLLMLIINLIVLDEGDLG